MANVSVTAANVLLVSGPTKKLNAAQAITAGQTLYETSSSTWDIADANDTATKSVVSGIALNNAAAGQPVVAAQAGAVVNIGGTIVPGRVYYQSLTAGAICPPEDQTVTTAQFTTVVGTALTTANLYFSPIAQQVAAA